MGTEKDDDDSSLGSKSSGLKIISPRFDESDVVVNNLTKENEILKIENRELKAKLDSVDKKIDELVSENKDLKNYIKDKSHNFDEMKSILTSLHGEISDMKKLQTQKEAVQVHIPTSVATAIPVMASNVTEEEESILTGRSESFADSDFGTQYMTSCIKKPDLPKLNIIPRFSLSINPVPEVVQIHIQTPVPVSTTSAEQHATLTEEDQSMITGRSESFADSDFGTQYITSCIKKPDLPKLNIMPKLSLTSNSVTTEQSKTVVQKTDKDSPFLNSGDSTKPNSKNPNPLDMVRKNSDFNEEFMDHYDDFSPSWRKECEKINLSKGICLY
jgi:hypothetical protein